MDQLLCAILLIGFPILGTILYMIVLKTLVKNTKIKVYEKRILDGTYCDFEIDEFLKLKGIIS